MEAPPSAPAPSFWSALLREPLVHFVLLGGLIFAADRAFVSGRDDPRVITVSPALEQELRALFVAGQGREPTPAEQTTLRERWIDNEVLYREGLALRLDQGDSALRERVIFKALNVIEGNLSVPKIDEPALRAWFEQHRSEYDLPARYDFAEAVLSGDRSESAAQRFVQALNAGTEGDEKSGLRLFKGRPRETIVASFGADFAAALEQMPLDHWSVLASSDGPRVVRLESRQAGQAASFDEERARVRQDWLDKKAQALRTAAVRELGKKYAVKLSGTQS